MYRPNSTAVAGNCGVGAETHHFLTPGQRRFMKAVCELTVKAIHAEADGKHVIDMDQIAEAIAKIRKNASALLS